MGPDRTEDKSPATVSAGVGDRATSRERKVRKGRSVGLTKDERWDREGCHGHSLAELAMRLGIGFGGTERAC